MSSKVLKMNKLRAFQKNLEKNESILMDQIFKMDNGQSISNQFKESSVSRVAEIERLQNEVKHMIHPLKTANGNIKKNIKNIGTIDLKSMKKDVTTIQKNLQNLKLVTRNKLETLKKKGEQLSEELETFQQKVYSSTKPPSKNIYTKAVNRKSSSSISRNISQEVRDFMVFIEASGGHENGWSVDDHNFFLKARSKTSDIDKLAGFVHTILPDISQEEVIAHEKWYQKYIELKENQKNAIHNWRSQKAKTSLNLKQNRKLNKNHSTTPTRNSYSDCLNKELQQQKIAEWKVQKRSEKQKQYVQQFIEKLKQKEMDEMQKQEKVEVKAVVDNWRKNKIDAEQAKKQEQLMKEENERKKRAVKANKMIKQFQTMDQELLQKKRQMYQIKPNLEVFKSKVEAIRDPERLYKPTRQWILRTHSGSTGNITSSFNLQTIPKLRIPDWRKGIS